MLNHNDYLGYMAHQYEISEAIADGIAAARNGENVIVPDHFTQSEIKYVIEQIENNL